MNRQKGKSKAESQDKHKFNIFQAALVRGPSYFEYQEYQIPLDNSMMENYQIIEKIGRGKYSDVYKAMRVGATKNEDQYAVLKILKPVRIAKIRRQIKILKALKHQSIINLEAVMYDQCCRTYALGFDYVEVDNSHNIALKDGQIRFFLKKLLEGLHFCHSNGIMHRDIKPQNVLVDQKKKQLKIIDWGLADFYLPKKDFNVRVASRYYKGPELLLNNHYYDYSLDLWSTGCWFASLIFRKSVIFKGMDNVDQLIKIGQILGSDNIRAYVKKYGLKPDIVIREWLSNEDYPQVPLLSFQTKDNMDIANDKAIDLLQKMLRIDHVTIILYQSERITALEALNHPYLKDYFN